MQKTLSTCGKCLIHPGRFMGSKKGFEVEYSDDKNQVCIIPKNSLSLEEFDLLVNFFIKIGYKYCLPADEGCGYLFSKNKI